MIISRRRLTGWLGASALSSMCSRPAMAAGGASALGLNTWSLRELDHDEAIPAILRVMRVTGLKDCQLLFSHAEPAEFDPGFASLLKASDGPKTPQQVEQQKQKSEVRSAWRLSVPMKYFADLRMQFTARGLNIRDYASPLGSSAAEIDRVLLMAKTMGAARVNSRIPESQTDMVAAAAERHGLYVGIQVTDTRLLAQQLRASSRLLVDPDIGDLTKAGISALDFVKEHIARICSIDLKDAVTDGGSVPFGSGGAQMRQVLALLRDAQARCIAYIDCDYPGTGRSTDEVDKCVAFARGILGG